MALFMKTAVWIGSPARTGTAARCARRHGDALKPDRAVVDESAPRKMGARGALLLAIATLGALADAEAAALEAARKIRAEPSIGHFGYLPFNKWLFGDSAHAHYATCDNYPLSQYNARRTCELVLVRIDNKAVSSNKTCPVQFQPNDRAPEKFLPAVRGDQVILPHVYFTRRNERNFPTEMYLQYRVVNMSSCESHDIRMLVNPEFVVRNNLLYFHNNIVSRDGGIGVFVPNDGLCLGALCRLDYDARGKILGEATSYLPPEMSGDFVQLFPASAPGAYFALTLEWRRRRADGARPYGDAMRLLHAAEGRSSELAKFRYKAGLTELFADASNGLFAVCRRFSARNSSSSSSGAIHCAQFDEGRARTMEAVVQPDNSTRPIALYNAPGGGLLLVSGKCGHKPDENLCQNLVFELIKRNGRGKVRHVHECEYALPIAGFARDGDDGQLCVSLYQPCDTERFQVFLTKKCYAKKMLL